MLNAITHLLNNNNSNSKRTLKCKGKLHLTVTQKIYFCRDLCFTISGLDEPDKIISFENFIESLKTTNLFWAYNSDLNIILVNESTKYICDNIANQLNTLVLWLNSNNCKLSGSFCYRTDKYIAMIYITNAHNVINHVIVPDFTIFTTMLDPETMINKSENQIRQYLKEIGILDVPIHYV